ncbi:MULTISPECIES: hypothetical protein [Rhodopseudomonas]|uniref:Uncharacterized protein n=1 Tax=Rhodopseudomonas palustris TaxID=1076 RepID=A0A0D7EV93_RHOPL|nr:MULTISPECIES: hypothetical protein [Rhodopseudomonas]KIZ44744.1 hypothetical protein OO17_09415 [Rhodopseudomonas palustris]MDF3814121.1 hypothetical protein [Rhodopseudomonas sp. BAL398]WOK15505.1 hypothetical protein RBJ75_15045 [Rhodopseudomonas sp. BAL398]
MDPAESGATFAHGAAALDCSTCAEIFLGRCAACERRCNPAEAAEDPLKSATLRGWIAGLPDRAGVGPARQKSLAQLLEDVPPR